MVSKVPPVDVSRRLRFDLKSLLLAIAAVAIVLAPLRLFGMLYLITVASSVALVGVCCFTYCNRTGGRTVGMAAMGLFAGFWIGMLAFVGHAFLNLVLCAILVALHVRPKTFAFAVMSLGACFYGWVIWNGIDEVRILADLRDKYPFNSLTERLAFERTPHESAKLQMMPLPLTPTVTGHLHELEESQEYNDGRSSALRQLHENTTMQFAFAAGFGPARMPMLPHPRMIDLPSREPFSPPIRLNISTIDPSAADLYPVHRDALFEFVDPDRMGYIGGRDAVAGFEAHSLSMTTEPCLNASQDTARWQVTRLELVSLLRHAEPRVYVAESLPQMDQLEDVPHRALSDFETTALPRLETMEDVVIDRQPERIQMLGAVRAATTCLECHVGQRGKLLGAFSYEILPIADDKAVAGETVTQVSSER